MPSSNQLYNTMANHLSGAQVAGAASNAVGNAFGNAAMLSAGATPFDAWVQAMGLSLNAAVPYQGARYFGPLTHPEPAVYMGTSKPVKSQVTHFINTMPGVGQGEEVGVVNPKQPAASELISLKDAENLPAGWSEGQVMDAMKKMQAAGFAVHSYDDVVKVWAMLVGRASDALMVSGGINQMTPWDALALYGKENASQGLGPGGSHTTTNVSRSVSDITQGEAWNTLQQTLSMMLGRDPTDNELRDFVHRMNHLAVRNPSVTHSTSTTDANGNTTTSSHTNPGFTSADMAEAAYNQAQQNPDYGAYQAGATYFNAALSALGALGNAGSNT